MKDPEALFGEVFELSEQIRYIAVYEDGELYMRQRKDIGNVSSGESDKYEEILVNPVLIKLATQRGDIDCGGLDYLIIRYGHFFVLLTPSKKGHVNIGLEPGADPMAFIEPLNRLWRKYELK